MLRGLNEITNTGSGRGCSGSGGGPQEPRAPTRVGNRESYPKVDFILSRFIILVRFLTMLDFINSVKAKEKTP